MESSHPLQLNNPIIPGPEQVLDPFEFEPIWPDATEPVGLDSPSLLPEQLPVPIAPSAGYDLFHRHIQGQISSHLSPPPSPLPPLAAKPPDAIVRGSFAVNQEAVASFGGTGTGLNAEYFDNVDFTNPVFTDIDPTIDLNWGKGSPDPSIGSDTFSVRWTGKVQPLFTESYSFHTRSDDGTRLWVNGELLIDHWRDQRVTERSGDIFLEAGQLYDITLEYYENRGKAVSQLLWSSPSQPQEIIPASQLYPLPTSAIDEPQDLLFITDALYNPTDAIAVMGKVYDSDGVRDLARIDFSLQKDGGERIDVSDAVDFTTDSNDYGYAFFSHDLGQLSPGHYQLQGTAYDLAGGASNTETTSFTVLSLPPGDELSQRVQWAIDLAQELDNYDPDALMATSEWVISVQAGQSSPTLADSFGAVDLGATGYIPNTYVWQFPSESNPFEVASQLALNFQVEFAYPLVTVPVIFHAPIDEPFVADGRQWHLLSPDANISNVWAQDVLGRNVTIGVIDNGFETDDFAKGLTGHPDLSPNYLPDLSYDFDERDRFPSRLLNATQNGRTGARGKEIKDDRTNKFFLNTPFSGGLVNELDINFNISHPDARDLSVVLVSPDDTQVDIPVIDGRNSADLTEFFKDERAGGTWKLEIEYDDDDEDDDEDDDDDDLRDRRREGRLNSWSLEFETINSHGTAVAGVAAASGNNGIGGSGVAPEANWAGLRMGADGTNGREIAKALSYSNQAIDIYNNSWGTGFFNIFPAAEFRLKNLDNGRGGLGNIYVFSGGNVQRDSFGHRHGNVNYNSLANSRHTIAVAAIDHQGKQALYSEPGAPLLVSAYSSSGRLEGDRGAITTTFLYSNDGNNRNDYTDTFGGTSASAPFVSGVAALILDAKDSLTWRDTQHILVETAQKNDPSDSDWRENGAGYHVNHKYGFGAIDAEAAVDLARNWTPVGEEVSVGKWQFVGEHIPRYNPNTPLTSKITINPEDDIITEWVEVEFRGTHRYLGDLEIVLISPDGTESVLAEQHFHGKYTRDNDSYHWTFTSARHWGESAVGEWTLQVKDKDIRNPSNRRVKNVWNSWELRVFGTEPTPPTNNPPTNNPPTDDPPTDNPPTDNPPTDNPPTDNPPTDNPPTDNPPTDNPPTDNPPTDNPPDAPTNNPPTLTTISPLNGAIELTAFTITHSELLAASDAADGDGDAISFQIASLESGTLTKNNVPVEPGTTTLSEDEELLWISDAVGESVPAFTVLTFDGKDASSTPVPVNITVAAIETIEIPSEPWVRQIESPGIDYANDLVTDRFGNVYMTGRTQGSLGDPHAGSNDIFVTKYDPEGNLLWTRQLGTPGGDASNGIIVEREGNVYIAGGTQGTLGEENAGKVDAFAIAYDRDGNLEWSQQLGTADYDSANDITIDSSGNVYIMGVTEGSLEGTNAGSYDVFVSKYNSDGDPLWTRQSGTSGYDYANAIAIDNQDNVYLTGYTTGSFSGNNAGGNDAFTIKYDSDGNLLWQRQLGTSGSDLGNAIATDATGVYITGSTAGNLSGTNTGNLDAFVAKYDFQGILLWQQQLGTDRSDISNGIITDDGGNLYITGTTYGDLGGNNAGGSDAFLAKYDSLGTLLEIQQLGTPGDDFSNGISIDRTGNVYIGGSTTGSLAGNNQGSEDAWVGKNYIQPSVTITVAPGNASEDDGNGVVFTIASPEDLSAPLNVNYSTDGNATVADDYLLLDSEGNSLDGTVTIPAGESSVTLTLQPIDDRSFEGEETVVVNVIAGIGYQLGGDRTASASIADNDVAPNIVTNTNDSGVGSLRDAIAWANDNPGRDTITFDIPGDGPHTISPTSPIPDITEAVLIDGWSENGDTPPATPLIELDGSSAGLTNGLTIIGSNVEVRGLAIDNWQWSGIRIQGVSATDNWIYGNFIGTNLQGTAAASNGGDGVIIVDANNNIVGTNGDGIADAAEANLISGNFRSGVDIYSDANIVAGNRIGTNESGTEAISNGEGGVDVSGNANRIGTNGDGIADAAEANLISGNATSGVKIRADSTSNIVAGNRIGTNLDGTAAIGNADDGVSVSGNANIIGTDGDGTADAAEANLISGNQVQGVEISSGNDNVVAGNRIGTNRDGTAAIANSRNGLYIIGDNNIIGTDGDGIADAAEANLISGNSSYGVYIVGGNSNVVAGNLIGTNLEGTAAVGNGRDGVLISDDNNIVGTNGDGTADAAEANLISGNSRFGVYLQSDFNLVVGNRIGTNRNGTAAIANGQDDIFDIGNHNIIDGTNA